MPKLEDPFCSATKESEPPYMVSCHFTIWVCICVSIVGFHFTVEISMKFLSFETKIFVFLISFSYSAILYSIMMIQEIVEALWIILSLSKREFVYTVETLVVIISTSFVYPFLFPHKEKEKISASSMINEIVLASHCKFGFKTFSSWVGAVIIIILLLFLK